MSPTSFVFNDQLDGQFLESIYDGDTEHAEMVFEQFVTSVKGHQEEIETAYAGGNAEVFRKSIHKFKPVLSFVGLTKLTEAAAQIEKKCSGAGHTTDLSADYTLFKHDLNSMIPVVENELIKLKSLTP